MTDVNVLPDVELLVVSFYVAQPEVAAIADGRIYTELPKDKDYPLVRVHQFGTLPARSPLWYETATVQIEAYGGAKRTARLLADTCRAVMEARLVGVHDEGVVTGVSFTGFADLPDDTFDPAKPRFLFTALITSHP